jgi:hypothetical protein
MAGEISTTENIVQVSVTENVVALTVVEQPVQISVANVGIQGSQGPTGATGPSNVLSVGTVTGGASAGATITGTTPSQVLNLVLPTGATGATGSAGIVSQTSAPANTEILWLDTDEPAVAPASISVTSPITNSGTSTSAQLGFDQTSFPRNSQRKFISNRYYYPSNALTRASTPFTLGSLYFSPFEVPTTTTFNQMSIAVATGVASSTVRLGIYNADMATLTPSSLVLDAGTVSAATSASYPTVEINQTLTAGLYFLVFVVQGVTGPTLYYFTSGPYLNYTVLPTTQSGVGGSYVQTSVTGALPSTASVSLSANQIICAGVAIRAA